MRIPVVHTMSCVVQQQGNKEYFHEQQRIFSMKKLLDKKLLKSRNSPLFVLLNKLSLNCLYRKKSDVNTIPILIINPTIFFTVLLSKI